MFDTFHAIIFWRSNVLSQEVLAENRFWHTIATRGHYRSFCNQSQADKEQHRHIMLPPACRPYLWSFRRSSRSNHYIKIAVVDNPALIWFPAKTNPENIRMHLIFSETRAIGLHFLSLHVWVFIQICAVCSQRRIFSAPECVLAVQGRSGSSKVDDFGTNRKRVCYFLLVRHCDYGLILHGFWDTATYCLKMITFPTPLSFDALAPYVLFGISRWS